MERLGSLINVPKVPEMHCIVATKCKALLLNVKVCHQLWHLDPPQWQGCLCQGLHTVDVHMVRAGGQQILAVNCNFREGDISKPIFWSQHCQTRECLKAPNPNSLVTSS